MSMHYEKFFVEGGTKTWFPYLCLGIQVFATGILLLNMESEIYLQIYRLLVPPSMWFALNIFVKRWNVFPGMKESFLIYVLHCNLYWVLKVVETPFSKMLAFSYLAYVLNPVITLVLILLIAYVWGKYFPRSKAIATGGRVG